MPKTITKQHNGKNLIKITMSNAYTSQDTIVALATPQGSGAIGVIRVSGNATFDILQQIAPKTNWSTKLSHTVHLTNIYNADHFLDEVLVTLFKNPKSYTGEDVIEIACHGSTYIIQQILQLIVSRGARFAMPGEFTQRAFLKGRMDLTQAEAVADLIASESEAAHKVAMNQMRGGFSNEINELRTQLINFASLIELELDFSEEDVEFADRSQLKNLINKIRSKIDQLLQSFNLGQVIKNGVPTAIVGKPNAGKSTLLNNLLNEEKAIVSDIPGTTRDFIEDELVIEGVSFRFIDTAGLRETVDKIESIGVERTKEKMKTVSFILYLFDVNTTKEKELIADIEELKKSNTPFLVVGNKIDQGQFDTKTSFNNISGIQYISAKSNLGIEDLKLKLLEQINFEKMSSNQTLVTNVRHYDCLLKAKESLQKAQIGLEELIPGDLLAQDIRESLFHLGSITGEVTADDLLGNIFSKFCIGK